MEVVILPTATDIARRAADAVEGLLKRKPNAVLGLATGSSPVPLYQELIRRHREEGLSFAGTKAFLLDDYVGLSPEHPEAYRNVIEREFVGHVDIPGEAVRTPDGNAADIPAAAAEFEAAIKGAGGVDLQILGIGTDGHIAFNEPGSALTSRTRVKTLTEQTRIDNSRFFDSLDEVPVHCVTQGLGTILEARHLVLIATGANKAEAVAQLVEGPVSAFWPATAMQLHAHATVFVDEAAAADLKLRDYYDLVQQRRPVDQPW